MRSPRSSPRSSPGVVPELLDHVREDLHLVTEPLLAGLKGLEAVGGAAAEEKKSLQMFGRRDSN